MASEEAKNMIKMFKRYDEDGDGVVDRYELAEVLTGLDSKWSGERIGKLFEAIDTDDDGKVEMDEFVEWVFGGNVDANTLMAEKPLMCLRLNGFGLRSYQDLADALSPLGEFSQLHHVKGNSKESIVVYDSEEAARKVFEALGGTYDADHVSAAGQLRVRCNASSPLAAAGEAALDLDQVVCLTPRTFSEVGAKQACPDKFAEELSIFVNQHQSSLGDDYDKWRGKMDGMSTDGLTVPVAAKFLRLMSMNMQIKPDQTDNAAMWRRTMRLLSRGVLEFEDSGKMSDVLLELDSFTAGGEVRPVSAAKSRATKKARDMGIDDPWAMISRGHSNSVLNVLAAGA